MPNPLKQNLRRIYLAKRDAIDPAERHAKSLEIGRQLTDAEHFAQARQIAFYCTFGSEVDTREMMRAAFKSGKRVFLPTINPKSKTMSFSEHDGNFENLVCNFFGIAEPEGPPAEVSLLDLIIVPGIAFDPQGWRLGYGAGYYDRFLKTVYAPTIGVAFAAQIHNALPVGENDVPVDLVITENAIHKRTEPRPVFKVLE